MKITMYELLGMIKDGKAPKRIIYDEYVYELNEGTENYEREIDPLFTINWDYVVMNSLNDEVEILEEKKDNFTGWKMYQDGKEVCSMDCSVEEEKKIPEKLEEFGLIQYNLDYIDYKNIETLKEWLNKDFQTIYDTIDLIIKNQNQLIDYLKSKGE